MSGQFWYIYSRLKNYLAVGTDQFIKNPAADGLILDFCVPNVSFPEDFGGKGSCDQN